MKTNLQKTFEEQTPTIKNTNGLEYLQTYCAWLETQIEKQNTEKFELTNVARYIKENTAMKQKDNLFEKVAEMAKKDGYHSFNNRDLTMLLTHKLEKVEPEKMKSSRMLREVGLLNVFNTDDADVLNKVFQYCISVILWLDAEKL